MDKKTAIKARRSHIIDAALTCFLEKGFNQTGIRDIARRAEISLGNLYNHFPSKKSVLIEIASQEEKEIGVFVDLLADHVSPEKTLRRFLTDYTNYCNQSGYVTLSLEVIGEAIRDRAIAELFISNRIKLVDALADLLKAGQNTSVFHAHKDNREIAEVIIDSIEGYATRMVLEMRKPPNGSDVLHAFLIRSILI